MLNMCREFIRDNINDEGGSNESNLNCYNLKVFWFDTNTNQIILYSLCYLCLCQILFYITKK